MSPCHQECMQLEKDESIVPQDQSTDQLLSELSPLQPHLDVCIEEMVKHGQIHTEDCMKELNSIDNVNICFFEDINIVNRI
jgi:hypothetical protein